MTDSIWDFRLKPCIEDPGVELLVLRGLTRRQASTSAYNIRKGIVHLPPGEWSASHDQLDDGSYGVFAILL